MVDELVPDFYAATFFSSHFLQMSLWQYYFIKICSLVIIFLSQPLLLTPNRIYKSLSLRDNTRSWSSRVNGSVSEIFLVSYLYSKQLEKCEGLSLQFRSDSESFGIGLELKFKLQTKVKLFSRLQAKF